MSLDILIYVLCYDDRTEAKAQQNIETYLKNVTTKIIRLPPENKYMEFYMYTDYLPNHKEEWENRDYVGTLSWRFPDKIRFNRFALHQKLQRFNSDIFTFMKISANLFKVADYVHPGFIETWRLLFKNLGFEKEEEIFPKITFCFFCNYWVAKPALMSDFIEFAHSVKTVIDSLSPESELFGLLNKQDKYDGKLDQESLLRLFGRPYYIIQPFILERLICFFVRHKNYKVMF